MCLERGFGPETLILTQDNTKTPNVRETCPSRSGVLTYDYGVHTLHFAVTVVDTKCYQRGENKDEDMSMEHTWEEDTLLDNISYNTRKKERYY
jgi:hypothetical protein